MSRVMVYTIDDENWVVDQFECEREFAISEYFNQRNNRGRYLIANVTDDIPYKFRRKQLKSVSYQSENPI